MANLKVIRNSTAESEFEKYRVTQDKLFSSDFDKFNSLPFDDIDKV